MSNNQDKLLAYLAGAPKRTRSAPRPHPVDPAGVVHFAAGDDFPGETLCHFDATGWDTAAHGRPTCRRCWRLALGFA